MASITFVLFLLIISAVIVYLTYTRIKKSEKNAPNKITSGKKIALWVLFMPVVVVMVYFLLAFGCEGTIQGAPLEDYRCFGSHSFGVWHFGFGFLVGILLIPISFITTIIGLVLLAKWKYK